VAGALVAGADSTAADAGRLSLHFHEAERYRESWHWSRQAAEQALAAPAPAEAAAHYERAMAAAAHLPGLRRVDRAATAEALGDACELSGRYEAAEAAYAEARRLTRDHEQRSRILRKSGTLCERGGRYSGALRWYTRAIKSAERIGDQQARRALIAQAEVAYAGARHRQGRLEDCVQWADRAVSDALAGADWSTLAQGYYLLESAYSDLGDPRAEHFRDMALPIFTELGDNVGLGNALNNLGVTTYFAGDWIKALRLYEESRAARLRAGDDIGAAMSDNNIGEILSDQGVVGEAERLFRQARRTWVAAGYTVGVALVTSNLGRVAVRAGRPQEGLDHIDAALAEFRRMGAEALVADTLTRRAEALLALDRHVEAWESATDAIELMERGACRAAAERLRGMAVAASRGGERARRCYLDAIEHASEAGATYEEGLALEALSRLGGPEAAAHWAKAMSVLISLGVSRAIDEMQHHAFTDVPGAADEHHEGPAVILAQRDGNRRADHEERTPAR
jgi:tetratricopeptide (TPR) repeat protein